MKTQSSIFLTALLLAGALTTSCSRQAPEPFDLYSRGPKGNAAVLMAPPAHYVDIDLSKAQYSEDGTRVEFDVPVKYGDVGTYFPTVRVTNSRSGQPETFAQIQNVGRVRLIVEL